jgi:hypothetical protein
LPGPVRRGRRRQVRRINDNALGPYPSTSDRPL